MNYRQAFAPSEGPPPPGPERDAHSANAFQAGIETAKALKVGDVFIGARHEAIKAGWDPWFTSSFIRGYLEGLREAGFKVHFHAETNVVTAL